MPARPDRDRRASYPAAGRPAPGSPGRRTGKPARRGRPWPAPRAIAADTWRGPCARWRGLGSGSRRSLARPAAVRTVTSNRSWIVTESVTPEPGEQALVSVTAAQEHVLAVVDHHSGTRIGSRGAAEPRARLQQRHGDAGVAKVDRGRNTSQAAADNYCPPRGHGRPPAVARALRGRPIPARAAAAIIAFSRPGSDIRLASAVCGLAAMCSSSRR